MWLPCPGRRTSSGPVASPYRTSGNEKKKKKKKLPSYRMAVPGRNNDGQVAYPELSTLICGSCKDGEESMAVVGFCVDCNEYLCELCFKYHNRTRYYAHHRLQDINEMPCQQFLDTSISNVNICSKHEGERVRIYCRSHRKLGCGRCIIKYHRSCEDIVDVCDEYNNLDSNLKQLKQEYTEQAGHAEAHIPRIEKIKEDAVDAIKKFHGEILDISNKLKNASMEEVEKLRSKDDEIINGISENCVSNLRDIDLLSTGLNTLYEGKRIGELYMEMEEKRSQILQLETDLRTIHGDNIINECVFEPSCQLSTMLQCLDSLGTMVTEKDVKTKRQTEVSGTKMDDMEMKDSDDLGQNLDGSRVFTRGVQTRGQRSCVNWKGWIIGAVVMVIVAILISAQLSNTFQYLRDVGIKTDQDNNKPPVSVDVDLKLDQDNNKPPVSVDVDIKTDQDNNKPPVPGDVDLKTDQDNNKPPVPGDVDLKTDQDKNKPPVSGNVNLKTDQDNNKPPVPGDVGLKTDQDKNKPPVSGNVNLKTDQDKNKPPVSGSETRGNKKLEFIRNFDVRTDQDGNTPYVYGLEIVSESRLIFVDFNNDKVKLLDTKLAQITSELKLKSYPWDVSIIDEHKAAVTLPGARSIQLVIISDTLSLGKKIRTRSWCAGITYWDNKLAVTCRSDTTYQWRLHILDLTGKVLNSITPKHNVQLLFGSLRYVTVSSNQELYVSDWTNAAVYRVSMQGEVKAIYKHPGVLGPRGLTVSPGGTVYFCDEGSGRVYQIDPESDGIQKVLGRENKVKKPRAVSYSRNKLYIGTENGKIHVFHWK